MSFRDSILLRCDLGDCKAQILAPKFEGRRAVWDKAYSIGWRKVASGHYCPKCKEKAAHLLYLPESVVK